MLQKSTIKFLKDLNDNNNREWFNDHKKDYEAARDNFIEFVDEQIAGIGKFDPSIKGQEGKKCMFRIYRDVRFSKDKSPYKPHFGAVMTRNGRQAHTPGYYFHLEPGGKTVFAGGAWMPPADKLAAIRQEIDYNTKDFKKILNNKTFKELFDKLDETDMLKTAPKGYPKDHPEIELLRHRSFVVFHRVPDKQLTTPDLLDYSLKVFKAIKPFDDFLIEAMD